MANGKTGPGPLRANQQPGMIFAVRISRMRRLQWSMVGWMSNKLSRVHSYDTDIIKVVCCCRWVGQLTPWTWLRSQMTPALQWQVDSQWQCLMLDFLVVAVTSFMYQLYQALKSIYTVSPQKTCDYIFYNNFNNRCPITIIFGTVSSKSMRHRKMVSFPTSPI